MDLMTDNYQYYIKRQDRAPKIPCGCGCGELIPSITRRGYPAKFKNGHGQRGELHSNWKGGRYKDRRGYWLIWKPDHPFADRKGYVPEHRWVYEQYYNVCLLPCIEIHHIEPVTPEYCNNDITNLLPVTKAEHRVIEQTVDMSDWRCSYPDCKDPTNPYSRSDRKGRQKWNYIEGERVCGKCYLRWYEKYKRKK